MYHLHPIRGPTGFIRTITQMNGANGRTCGVDPNRIHELVEERRNAARPLVDGDTRGSSMEREKFDQVSCLHPRPLRQRVAQGHE